MTPFGRYVRRSESANRIKPGTPRPRYLCRMGESAANRARPEGTLPSAGTAVQPEPGLCVSTLIRQACRLSFGRTNCPEVRVVGHPLLPRGARSDPNHGCKRRTRYSIMKSTPAPETQARRTRGRVLAPLPRTLPQCQGRSTSSRPPAIAARLPAGRRPAGLRPRCRTPR